MRKFSVFTAPLYSFFSRELFVDVGRRWGAQAAVYLLLVLALSWLPFMFVVRSGWSEFVENQAPEVIRQIPPITIDNGRVTADVDQPHFIRSSDSDEVFAIIDTTDQVTSLDGTPARALLTGSQLILKKSETETRVHDLSGVQHFYLDGPKVEKWLRLLGTWGLVLLYPVFVAGSYAYRSLQALFYSLFGLAIAKAIHCPLSYAGILRVTVVAVTPAVALKTLFGIVGVSFPFSWVLYFIVAIGYLTFGLSSNTRGVSSEGKVDPGEAPA